MRFCGWVLCYYNWILRIRVGYHLFSSHGYGLKTSTQNIHKHVLWPCLVMPPATVWKIVSRSVYLPRKTSTVFIMSNLTTQHKLRWCGTFTPMYTHNYRLVVITKVTSILSPWKKASTSGNWVVVHVIMKVTHCHIIFQLEKPFKIFHKRW